MRAVSALRRSVLALLALAGCDDLKDFRGTFEGTIVQGNFVRSCFAPETRATLRFNPNLAVMPPEDAAGSVPNTLSTSDLTFQDTPLESIRSLPYDHLSALDFPGPQRLKNYLLLARPSAGPLAGHDALVVVSLLASDGIELRIIARTQDGVTTCPGESDAAPDGGALDTTARREYFGLFRMKK